MSRYTDPALGVALVSARFQFGESLAALVGGALPEPHQAEPFAISQLGLFSGEGRP